MYIITVIPLSKNNQKDFLSYFSSSKIPLGHIVSVPVRNKNIDALVVKTEEAASVKSDLKKASYQLKKINKIKGQSLFSESFLLACLRMKDYSLGGLGTVIKSLSSIVLLNSNLDLIKREKKEEIAKNIKQEKLIYQSPPEDRFIYYKTLIRESFAKKESILFCLPSKNDIEIFYKELSKGIEDYSYFLHSKLSKKNLVENYNKIMTDDHSVLVICTGIFLSLPREDIRTIVVEKESSEAYKQLSRPYLDIRSFAEIYTSVNKIKLIFGDTLLRPETIGRYENGEFGEIMPPVYRFSKLDKNLILDTKQDKLSKDFNILGLEARKKIKEDLATGNSVFILTIRKGLAPLTVCKDCGETLLCKDCSAPMVLYDSKKEGRIFMCNKCGLKERTEKICPNCSSWNLLPLGIGIDKVKQELEKLFPENEIYQLDKENLKTNKEIEKVISDFRKNKGSILLGTNLAIPYLDELDINTSIITSLDGILSLPSFNITSRIIQIITKLHNVSKNTLLIQTRIEDNKILENIMSGNILPLYRNELKERKIFNYPPYKKLIKIRFEGNAKETNNARRLIENQLEAYHPQIYSAFISKVKGKLITNTVIKVDPSDWPLIEDSKNKTNENLKKTLFNLPTSFLINVDPEDLL